MVEMESNEISSILKPELLNCTTYKHDMYVFFPPTQAREAGIYMRSSRLSKKLT